MRAGPAGHRPGGIPDKSACGRRGGAGALRQARRLSGLADRSLEASCIPPVQRVTGLGLTGQGVLIGFIDSGMDLNHPEFLGEDGATRVVALWDMTAQGTPPKGFYHGAAYSREEIAAGLVASADTSGHGTAVAAIAAGRSGAAPGAAIAAVKLASARTTDIMRAIKYLLDQAEERGMPCVVNLSYGTNCGSHQGQTLFESYIDQSAQRGRSGDSGGGVQCLHPAGADLPVFVEKFCRRGGL